MKGSEERAISKSQALADWLKSQMRARGIGRNDLARLSGVSAGTISRITLENHVPGVEILFNLADFFGVERDAVLDTAGLLQYPDLNEELVPEVRQIAHRLYRLSSGKREIILRQFDALLTVMETNP